MSLRLGSLFIGAAAVLASFSISSNDAHACGGCFHEPTPVDQPDQATVVTGHRMALSVSTERTVLWDQIQYAGKPQDFAWVLPVKPGAYLELASDAFFEALDASTTTTIRAPQIACPPQNGGVGGGFYGDDYVGNGNGCSAFSCGAYAADAAGSGDFGGAGGGLATGGSEEVPPDPVTVVHNQSIGPYETVTIHSNVPGSLFDWLDAHGYAVDDAVKPMIDDYETEGFDFIALRLTPGENIQQMQPVRVVSPGASPVLPLRMVSAGTGAKVAITLFVIGEGRWATQNFPMASISGDDLTWDFTTESSDYATHRQEVFTKGTGNAWLTSYARKGPLFSQLGSENFGGSIFYKTSDGTALGSIYELYMWQSLTDGVAFDPACIKSPGGLVFGNPQVVDTCAETGGGGAGGAGTGGMPSGGTGGMPSGGAGGVGGMGTGGVATGGTGGAGGSPCNGTVGPNQIAANTFACGPADDIAAAVVGLHLEDVWVTRLESNMPHAALTEDLSLQADPDQSETDNWVVANGVANPPCADWYRVAAPLDPVDTIDQAPRRKGPPPSRGHKRDLIVLAAVLSVLGAAAARRIARPSLRAARASR